MEVEGNTVKSRFFLPLLSPLCGIHLSHLPLFSVFKYCTQPEDVNKVPKLGKRNKKEVLDGKENSEKGKEKKREFRRLSLLPFLSFPPTAGGYILPVFHRKILGLLMFFFVFLVNSTRIVFYLIALSYIFCTSNSKVAQHDLFSHNSPFLVQGDESHEICCALKRQRWKEKRRYLSSHFFRASLDEKLSFGLWLVVFFLLFLLLPLFGRNVKYLPPHKNTTH